MGRKNCDYESYNLLQASVYKEISILYIPFYFVHYLNIIMSQNRTGTYYMFSILTFKVFIVAPNRRFAKGQT